MSAKALEQRGRKAREWLMEACFPLWAERGVAADGFLEALDLHHRPIATALSRVRVQARQTYVFSEALRLGWMPRRAGSLVEMGVNVLANACRRDDGLFGRSLDLGRGALEDDTADLYDTAFGLYALAGATKHASTQVGGALMIGQVPDLIEQVSGALETVLKDPSGGYIESLPRPEYRLQNPHMHLFEASLELYGTSRDAHHLSRATALRELFLTRFFDRASGTLSEHFMPADWTLPIGDAGAIIEPGHQFEWVWLLDRFAVLTRGRLPDEARKLYELACQTLDESGRAIQSCLRDGTPVDASRRTWPQTEALKAHLAMWKRGDEAASARAVASFDVLMDEYLTPEGGWIDHYNKDGTARSQTMPASTGYHVVLAFVELINTVVT